MRKTLMVLAMVLFAFIAEVEAETRFNALSADDPHYPAYQVSLCQATFAEYGRMSSERYWLDHLDPKMAGMSPDRREEWVLHYVVATTLRDDARKDFDTNCR